MENKEVKHYLKPKSWVEAYSLYLKNAEGTENNNDKQKPKSCYIDIDAVNSNGVKVQEYYKDLTDFLNTQNLLILGRGYDIFKEPNRKDKRPGNLTIHTSDDKKYNLEKMYLTSDTFAFSQPIILPSGEWKTTHPLGAYLGLCKTAKKDTDYIAQYLYDTRTIGGAFIWPKIFVGEKWKSCYNNNRGVKKGNFGSYINDRVDLTLQEIKMFYHFSRENPEDDIKRIMNENGYVLLKGPDADCLCGWLRYFRSFEYYVKFFCFEDFVDGDCNPNPISIVPPHKPIEPQNPKVDVDLYMSEYRNLLKSERDIKDMLDYVSMQILKRSKTIESLLLIKRKVSSTS